MPRQIPKLNTDNSVVLGEDGKPIMLANTARDIWVTATTLTTALNLAIISYALSGLVLVLGIAFIFIGLAFYTINKNKK